MIVYVARRIALSVVTLFGISIALFGLLHLVPGDPTDLFVNPLTFNGDAAAAKAAMRAQLGLDQPLPVQYAKWLGQVLQGNLGHSYQSGEAVTQLIGERLTATLWLTLTGLVLGLALGIVFGIIAALRRNTVSDQVIQGGSLLGISVPIFFLGMVGMYVFGLQLRLLPTAGMNTPNGGWGGLFQHLVLPAGVLALTQAGMSREAAYAAVQRNAMKVWEMRGDRSGQFASLLKADPEVSQKLNPTEIDAMFDDFYHLKHVDAIFERVFGPDL